MDRKEVYEIIDEERDYQDTKKGNWVGEFPSLAEELIMIEEYSTVPIKTDNVRMTLTLGKNGKKGEKDNAVLCPHTLNPRSTPKKP